MVQPQEVVITGIGVVSPIGVGQEAFWTSLHEGHSGVRPLRELSGTELPVSFGAEILDFDPKPYITPRKSLKVMSREIQFGCAAATMALQKAGLTAGSIEPDRFGVVFGSEMFYSEFADVEVAARNCIVDGKFDSRAWGEHAMTEIYPLWMLKYLPNMVTCHITIAHDARGPNNTITQGEASSLLALIESVCVIQRGHADVVITGGTGTRLNLTPLLHRKDDNLSHRCDHPAAASRPFDSARDGMVNGEGAAAFVLESRQHAEARGAKVLARVVGFGRSFETPSNGQLTTHGAYHRAITAALREARMQPGQIGHVNAHGISTVEDDPVEARAIYDMLGETPVTAPKSFFGNLGTGGGAVELAVSVLAFEHGEVPATLNYENPDSQCPINVIHGHPLRPQHQSAIVLNKSSTGQVAAVLLTA
jgi:3-oxoacyl-[acyl-carrier-protein] synthase II